jgi:hypothetical protein
VSSLLGDAAGGRRCRHALAEACADEATTGGGRRDRGLGLLIIEGQQHIAIDLVPEVFADHVVAFLRDQR